MSLRWAHSHFVGFLMRGLIYGWTLLFCCLKHHNWRFFFLLQQIMQTSLEKCRSTIKVLFDMCLHCPRFLLHVYWTLAANRLLWNQFWLNGLSFICTIETWEASMDGNLGRYKVQASMSAGSLASETDSSWLQQRTKYQWGLPLYEHICSKCKCFLSMSHMIWVLGHVKAG